ncbi:hypothetical protein EMOOHJMP_00076 [Microcystis phage MaAM05]|nr:hypothetical protein EMOOHJMP_00076 [Microcystis phage MaAM05]
MRNAMSVSKLKYATLKNSSGLYNWNATNRKETGKESESGDETASQKAEGSHKTDPPSPEAQAASTLNTPAGSEEAAYPPQQSPKQK